MPMIRDTRLRSLPVVAVLALLAGTALTGWPTADGAGPDADADDDATTGGQAIKELWFAPDTGEVAPPPTTEWPDRVVVDAKSWMLLAVWSTDPPREEAIPMSRVSSIERARAWEGRPDEVVAVLRDGRRVLLARGANAATAATLLTAVVGRSVVEIPPDQDWLPAARSDGRQPDTTLALGSVRSGAAVATLIEDEQARRAAEGTKDKPERTVIAVDDSLPANADADALEPSRIKATVQARMARFQGCYQREFMRNPSLKGRVVVRFIIEEDGSVSNARLRETTMNNTVVEQCLVDEVARLQFEKPQAGKVVPVSFPFNFTGG